MGHLPDGAHTHGHGTGGPGGPLAAGAGVLIAAGVLPLLLAILHALLIAAAITIGVLLAAAAAGLAWRLRHRTPAPPWQPGTLRPPARPALAREVHLHLHAAPASPWQMPSGCALPNGCALPSLCPSASRCALARCTPVPGSWPAEVPPHT